MIRREAVIDIGSNSVRLLVADMEGRHIVPVTKKLNTTRISAGQGPGGILSHEAMERTVSAVSDFHRLAAGMGAFRVFCFATAAVREAANRDVFIRLVNRRTGLLPRVLTQEEEAAAGFAGVGHGEKRGVIDIGGGSTEFAMGSGPRPALKLSMRVGAVRAVKLYPPGNPADGLTLQAMQEWVRNRLEPLLPQIREADQEDTVWYGVGGTITTLAAMDMYMTEYDPRRIQGYNLSRMRVKQLLEELKSHTMEEIRNMPGLQPERADIIIGGTVIFCEVLKQLKLMGLKVSETDNLEGGLLFCTGEI